jgi:Tannase and feruloyl esterase
MVQILTGMYRHCRLASAGVPVVAALAVTSMIVAPAGQAFGQAAAPRHAAVALAAPTPCASLMTLSLVNTTINSATDTPAGTVPPPLAGLPPTPVVETCRVHATVTTPGVNDQIGVDVWMPVSGWNGRFQGVGGSGFVAGDPNDLAVVGKAVTAAYYGSNATYSYWNGCSTGGRQGLAEAQRYPSDFNGILAGAPAINWQNYVPALLWPELVMQQSGDFLPQCKFNAFQAAAIKACDTLGDGVVDGVIGDPLACNFDPSSLVGTSTPCGTITAQDAAVVAKIVAGPRTTDGDFLWYGLLWGTSFGGGPLGPFSGIANTTTSGGTLVGAPFPLVTQYLGTWVQQNPAWDWTTTTYDQFDQLFQQSVEMFGNVIGTDNPDLHAFKQAGGKLIIWQGLADQLIFPQGTIDYYTRVQQAMGGRRQTTDFARLFFAPGVDHCGLAPVGPKPDTPLNQLTDWVENGNAPSSLNGVIRDPSTGAVTATRPICMYPNVAVYKGHGPTTQASSFTCRHKGEE